jgi:hypothetical protein
MTNEEFIESIRLQGEEWRDVVGYEGYYKVSSLGRIASLARYVKRKHRVGVDSNYTTKPHISKTFFSKKSPYERIVLYVKRPDRRLVHRIVAEAFASNPNKYPEVDHINDNPRDNRACNLQWCTPKMNSSKDSHRKAVSIGLLGHVSSNRTPVVCLTLDGNLVKIYPSNRHAELEGFSRFAIYQVAHNKRKSHKGYKWMYLSDYEKSLVNQ